MEIIGSVKNKTAILVDDIIDTAGTLCNAAKGLIERGAKRVFACATHGVLSGPAIERLKNSFIEKVIITDTIPLHESKMCEKINQLSIAPLFAEAVIRVHSERSISNLFEK
jgi:ribose-phosphate pyrophosphokinase